MIRTMHYWILAIICHVRCGISTSFLSPTFPIGGIFETFQVKDKSLQYLRQEVASQYLAAFVMAIDEINAKRDGYFDDILPNTKLRMITVIGVNISVSYPLNDFIGGAGRAYLLRNRDSSLVAVVDTAVRDLMAAATAQTLNNWGILNLMSRSTSNTYAHGEFFPLTLQNAPPETAEAAALVDLIFFNYNWRYVTVVHSYDTQTGLDSFAGFMAAAASVDLTVISVLRVSSSETDFSGIINSGIASGAKIFVLFTGGTEAGRLLEQGYNLGLFHEGTQVFITSVSNIADIRSSFSTAGLANEAKILEGLISTAPFPERYFSTPQGQSFVTRFRNLPPTITTDPITKKKICNKRTDGGRLPAYLYRATAVAAIKGIVNESILCLGFESFKSFNQNGSNIDPNILFTYDFVYSYALAVNAIISAKPKNQTFTLLGPELYNYMTASTTSFPLLSTGNVSFISARGTRQSGNVFKILNYRAIGESNQYSEGGLAFIGEYTDSLGWLLCGNTVDWSVMSIMSTQLCSSPQYRTASGSIPPGDAPPPIIMELPDNFRIVLIVVATIGMTSLAVWGGCLFFFWQAKQIRTSQPRIMVFLLLGGVLGLIKVYLAAFKVTHVSCVCQLWLSHYAFRLIFRTLLLKLWRIHAVMNAGSFKRIIIAENTVLWFLLSDIVFMTVILLIPITIVSSLEGGLPGYVASNMNNQTILYAECQVSTSVAVAVLNGILYFSDGLNLIMAVYYTYKTRSVPASVNETSTVGPGENSVIDVYELLFFVCLC